MPICSFFWRNAFVIEKFAKHFFFSQFFFLNAFKYTFVSADFFCEIRILRFFTCDAQWKKKHVYYNQPIRASVNVLFSFLSLSLCKIEINFFFHMITVTLDCFFQWKSVVSASSTNNTQTRYNEKKERKENMRLA